jgi:DNA-binding NarL/FixJ family response regulator
MIVDDHAFLREGIEVFLRRAGMEVAASVGDGEAALDQLAVAAPDVILLDVRMPGINGVQFLRRLREQNHECGVVVLATDVSDAELLALVESQADAILFKSCSEEDLLATISTVAAGRTAMDRVLLERARHLSAVGQAQRQVTLSPRETEIVALIQRGLKNEEIAEKLGIKVGSVKVHVHSILSKTGARGRRALAEMTTAVSAGSGGTGG